MRTQCLLRLFIVLAAVAAILPGSLRAQTLAAGSTAGQFAVSGGSASYTIPLILPPGLGEMKPDLALTYNNNGGDGPLGLGWSLSGLSAVSLCPKTVAHDSAYAPISSVGSTANLRFCLDGQRLVTTSGVYGPSYTDFRTEIDVFSKVTANGWSSAVPTSFTVKTKGGQEFRYGEFPLARSHDAVTGSAPAITWLVDKVIDASGNYTTFSYSRAAAGPANSSPETLIDQIQYTGNANGTAPRATVKFNWNENRPDISYYPAAQYIFQRRRLLNSIQVSVDGAVVRSYTLHYHASGRSGRSLLDSVTECGANNTCLPPTTFTWNENKNGIASSIAGFNVPAGFGAATWVRTGDFNATA